MKLYVCDKTNEISEILYRDAMKLNDQGVRLLTQPEENGFCIVENFDYTYQKELPRFKKIAGIKPYGLPNGSVPRKKYLGIGNRAYPEDPARFWEDDVTLPKDESEALEIRDVYYSKEHCDVVWFKVHGSTADVPVGYEFCGYDINYTPDLDGAYSIINDCMFVCKWHGCDAEGTEFLDYYNKLNENGLFADVNTALDYMKHYLSFDWSERGMYCICEIYRRK